MAAGSATLTYDYELMEDYILTAPLGAFTNIAAVTNKSGLAEVFMIGGAGNTVNHVFQDPTSDTGWNFYSLTSVAQPGQTINAIAAAMGSAGRRAIAVSVSAPGATPSVLVTIEIEPGVVPSASNWTPWTTVASLNAYQLTLRVCNNTFQLGAVVQFAVYGAVTSWQVYSGELTCNPQGPVYASWQSTLAFYTDLCACDFLPSSQSTAMVTGCVSPTLSLFAVDQFCGSQPVWTTAGSNSFANPVSVFCPVPSQPDAVVISPLVVSGINTNVPESDEGQTSVLCAGSIEDASGQSGASLLYRVTSQTEAQKTWGSAHALTTLWTGLWEPNQVPDYTESSDPQNDGPATSWLMNIGNGNLNVDPTTGQIIIFETAFNWGMINDKLLVATDLLTPAITSTSNSNHALSIFQLQFQDLPANCYPNYYIFNQDDFSSPPPNGYFPAACITRTAGVLVQCPSGTSGGVTGHILGTPPAFSNWCQAARSDGTACSFAVDYTSGDLWFADDSPSAVWTNISSGAVTAPSGGFLPGSANGCTLAAMEDSQGVLHVFAVGADNTVYHIVETAEEGSFFDPVPLTPVGIGSISLVPLQPPTQAGGSPSGQVGFFAISNTATPSLYYVSLAANEYTYHEVLWEGAGTPQPTLVPVSAYTLDARLQDANGKLMAFSPVSVVSTQPCTAVVNGSTVRLVPGKTNNFQTNYSGGLHLIIPTADISATQLTLTSAAGTTEPFFLNSKVYQALQGMTQAAFETATDASGALLFPETSIAATVYNGIHSLFANATAPSQGALAAPPPNWKITFDGTRRATYTSLPDEAGDHGAESSPLDSGSTQISALWDDIKNWFSHAPQKAADSVQLRAQSEPGGMNITITVTINGNPAQYNITLNWNDPNLPNSVLDMAAMVMVQAGALPAQVAQWLEKRFDWPQINTAQSAFITAINSCFALLENSATDIQTFFDQNFSSSLFTANNNWSTALESVASSQLGQLLAPLTLPSVQCNFLSSKLMDFCNSATPPSLPDLTSLTGLQNSIKTCGGNVLQNTDVQDQVQRQGANPTTIQADQVLSQAVSTASSTLETIVTSLIPLLQGAVDDVLELGATNFETLAGALNTPLTIPCVSQLYELRFNGQQMTILGLITAAIAIPAVTAFESVNNSAPFGQNGSSEFTAGFTANISAIWSGQPNWEGTTATSLNDGAYLLALGGFFTRLYVDQILDAIAAGQGPSMTQTGTFVLSVADISSSMALFASSVCTLLANMIQSSSYTPSPIEVAAVTVSGAHWAIDTLFTCLPAVQATLRLDGDAGVCMDMALSLASASLSAVADGLAYGTTWQSNNPPIPLAADILAGLAAISHIGLVKVVMTDSDYTSVPPVLLLDYSSDQCGLAATVQAMQASAAGAAA